ncbi:MAG TPA: sugar phosphate isomerase/epimerase [Armatimonadota bacterium]|nr:sugar phosphate isomerase/epimerase [Armatimonadota bacterium]
MKIGVRQVGPLPQGEFCRWLKENDFSAIDVGEINPEVKKTVAEAGLEIGTADLGAAGQLLRKDAAQREAGVENCKKIIRAAAENGVKTLFCVFIPEDHAKGRAANFELWKETFPTVAQFAESQGVRIAMEGWPGPGPSYPALGCTPEMWRAMFAAVPSPAFGLNYDPSHLVRIGVDYRRALHEFADRVFHVHGKDTDLDSERLYEHGNLGPVFHGARGFGEDWWRYTIPGDGVVQWGKVIERLQDAGYDGIISIELEDYRYWKDWDARAAGLLRGKDHLAQFI